MVHSFWARLTLRAPVGHFLAQTPQKTQLSFVTLTVRASLGGVFSARRDSGWWTVFARPISAPTEALQD